MLKSIKWKFVIIYFLLVFIAMAVIGVFLLQQFESYHLGVVEENMKKTGNSITTSLGGMDWKNNEEEIQENINYFDKMGMEIYIIDNDTNLRILASTNFSYVNINATAVLDTELIIGALNGNNMSKIIVDSSKRSSKHTSRTLYDEDSRIIGVLYLRRNLVDVYNTLEQSKTILTKATLLALSITIILGYIIASSITAPINDVTVKVKKMAMGDFDQKVEVKSNDEIGQLASMFNYLTDRLKSLVKEISSEKQKLDTIITNMADGLIAATRDGKIIHANPRALEILGMSEQDIQEKTYDSVLIGLNKKLTLEYIKENDESWSGSQIITWEDKTAVRASYAPYVSQGDNLGGIIVLLQDITKHEKFETMRKEFVANVSHELKTPITTIKSYTETLLDGAVEEGEMMRKFLNIINLETDRMTRLVGDLLQLSNIDSKQIKWDKKTMDPNDVINRVIYKLDMSIQKKELKLTYIPIEEGIKVYADEDRIEQVLLNIINNAVKYTAKGGTIRIETRRIGENLKIMISDNGMGIPVADIPRVFERFYRVDKARTRDMGGTGLGLSIAKEIVEAHGGSISVSSNTKKGTEVVILLPNVKTVTSF
ncbi:MAG: cell wall metabolism sensor histidine kinase WalK [Clostridiales bacterium]|nr:cell wall metabolism sensor histidine kinase WalK [Clostridiales bacterium]